MLINYFAPAEGMVKNKRKLYRRAELIGAQTILNFFLAYTLLAILFTEHTALARFKLEYQDVAVQGVYVMAIVSLILIIDDIYSIIDLRSRLQLTTSKFYRHISVCRPWLLYLSGMWMLLLMSVSEVESGVMAVMTYIFLYGGAAIFSLILTLRDGCVDNKLQLEKMNLVKGKDKNV